MITNKQRAYLKSLIKRGYNLIYDYENEAVEELLDKITEYDIHTHTFTFKELAIDSLDNKQICLLITTLKKEITEYNKQVRWLWEFHADYYDKYLNSELLKAILKNNPLEVLGERLCPYHYYAFEGETYEIVMPVDTLIKNFDLLDHEEEIMSNVKDGHVWEAINDFCMQNEIFGGDLVFEYPYEI